MMRKPKILKFHQFYAQLQELNNFLLEFLGSDD